MSKTIEELMQPKYKVIADFPQSAVDDCHKLIIGDILKYLKVNGSMTYRRVGRCGYMSVGVPCISNPEKYPAIFKKLEWWEEIPKEDIPEYVKYWDVSLYYPVDRVCKGVDVPFKDTWTATNFQPATKEEYDQYVFNRKKEFESK